MKRRINFPYVAFAQTQTAGHPLAIKQFRAVSHRNMHAAILHLVGVDVRRLTYDYDGRMETPIGESPARVLKEVIV